MSVRVMAAAMSLRCSVRRLFSSEWFQDRSVSSRMNISHACGRRALVGLQPRLVTAPQQQSEGAAVLRADCVCAHPREEHRRLRADHPHVLVRLHDLRARTRAVPLRLAATEQRTRSSTNGRALKQRATARLLYPRERQLVVFELCGVRADAQDLLHLLVPELPQLLVLLRHERRHVRGGRREGGRREGRRQARLRAACSGVGACHPSLDAVAAQTLSSVWAPNWLRPAGGRPERALAPGWAGCYRQWALQSHAIHAADSSAHGGGLRR